MGEQFAKGGFVRLSIVEMAKIDLAEEVEQSREVLTDLFEVGVSGEVAAPIVVLVEVWHEVELAQRWTASVSVEVFYDIKVVTRVAVFVYWAFRVALVEQIEG